MSIGLIFEAHKIKHLTDYYKIEAEPALPKYEKKTSTLTLPDVANTYTNSP